MAATIEIRRLGKRYRLGTDSTGYDTIRDAITRTVTRRRLEAQDVWALRDVDLDIARGESVAIIGDNAAGKTTLLKVLAGITEPTEGEARVRGRVGALLDVGTGFHSELTGRENVYLSGALLGLSRAEISALFDEIIEFSGLDQYVETPVKRYSAGMRLRLAFAVAAFIRPAVLVVDEILAVGDVAFREKCLGRMAEISAHERTVLFVSHDLAAVSSLCSRAVWLERGVVRQDGATGQVLAGYTSGRQVAGSLTSNLELSVGPAAPTRVRVLNTDGGEAYDVRQGDDFVVELECSVSEHVPGLDVAIMVRNSAGIDVIDVARSDQGHLGPMHVGRHLIKVRLPGILISDQYTVSVWLGTQHEDVFLREVLSVPVSPRPEEFVIESSRHRVVRPEIPWDEHREPLL